MNISKDQIAMRALLIAAALFATAAPVAVLAQAPSLTEAPVSAFERDRQSILAQAGQYQVRFDMRETVSFQASYTPLGPKTSGGNEIVRVVYDDGDRISLQHILVMEHEGQSVVVKHWRQDWVWEPQTVLTYAGPDRWTLTPVPEEGRRGAWSQTVWQTDDSPRYGGVGRWSYDNGMAEWTSGPTWRPLARRDATRNPVYDRYLGANRHALTPSGWVHIQDNMKLGTGQGDDGELVAYVQEDVVNTYRRFDDYDPAPGDTYWAATKDYWAEVRKAWDETIVANGGIALEEEADAGSVTGTALMGLASQINDGLVTTEVAVAQAREIIVEDTARP